MKSIFKYIIGGMIVGGILPGILHPLGITVFASTADILIHLISVLIGVLISLVIYKLKRGLTIQGN